MAGEEYGDWGDIYSGAGNEGWGWSADGGWSFGGQPSAGPDAGVSPNAKAFLPPELAEIWKPDFGEVYPTGIDRWAWSPQTDWVYGNARAPGGPAGLLPEFAADRELAGRQADYHGLTGAMKEQYIQDTLMGLNPAVAATRVGIYTPYSFGTPPNIKGNPELAAQYQQMAKAGMGAGVSPELMGSLRFATSRARAPAYPNAPLLGYQTPSGATLGNLAENIGAMTPELRAGAKPTTATLDETLQFLEQNDPRMLYMIQLRDWLDSRLAEGTMDAAAWNEELKNAAKLADTGVPVESLPHFLESSRDFQIALNNGIVSPTMKAYVGKYNQDKYGSWFGKAYGGGEQKPVVTPKPTPAVEQPAQPTNPMTEYQQYITVLGLSHESQNYMLNQFEYLYATWLRSGTKLDFVPFVQLYLSGGA